jgi:hypothetical protein
MRTPHNDDYESSSCKIWIAPFFHATSATIALVAPTFPIKQTGRDPTLPPSLQINVQLSRNSCSAPRASNPQRTESMSSQSRRRYGFDDVMTHLAFIPSDERIVGTMIAQLRRGAGREGRDHDHTDRH